MIGRVRTELMSVVAGLAAVMLVGVVGCAPDIDQDPDPEPRVKTLFDSQTGVIPLPNDVALDSDGTLPAQPGAGDDNAQGYLLSYLSTLHGFLPVQPIEIPFDGELDPSTATAENVRLYHIPQDGGSSEAERLDVASVEVESETFQVSGDDGGTQSVEGSMLTIQPAAPLQRDRRYAYIVTDDVQSADGRETVASQPVFFAGSEDPLVDEQGNKTVDVIPSDDLAQQLEGLRQISRPVFEVAANNEIERDSIVAASVWTTFQDTMAVFDPAAGDIPLPNDFVRQGDGGTVSIPIPDGASQLQQQLLGELRTRTGFSTVAPGWIRFNGPIDTETLDTDSFLSMSLRTETSGLYEEGRFETTYLESSGHLIFEPTVPLRRDTELGPREDEPLNIWAVTSDLEGAQGWSVKSSPTFVLLRSPYALVDSEGNSTVSLISDSQAQQLEPARQQYNQFINVANSLPTQVGLPADFELPRDDIAAAFFAHPSNPLQSAQTWRARALEELGDAPEATRAANANCTGGGSQDCEQNPSEMPNVQIAQHAAEMETVLYLQSDGSLDAENPTSVPVGLSVFVPQQTGDCGSLSEFPVAIVQHGLSGWREGLTGVVDALAAECVASVTMDFVGHGGRTPGTSELHPDSNPLNSGENFISPDLVRTKHHFLQSFVDLSVLAEYIASDGLETAIDDAAGTNYFDYGDGTTTKIGYVGQSLGGLIGTSFTAIDDETTVAGLNVAGGKLSRVLSEGALGGDIISALRNAGIEEGSFDEVQALSFIQWVAEPVDPVTFAPYLTERPATELTVNDIGNVTKGDELPDTEPLVQMAVGDSIIPNSTTEALVRAMGDSVSLENTTFDASHGFLTASGAAADSPADCARRQLAAWLSSGLGIGGSSSAMLPDNLSAENCVSQ